jgi:hypothetical protein
MIPVFSGSFITDSLAEVLRKLVEAKQTGILTLKQRDKEGTLVIENGIILNATTGSQIGLHALFQFIAWREARFDFQEKPVLPNLARDLAVYDPQVLIQGVATKVEELPAFPR